MEKLRSLKLHTKHFIQGVKSFYNNDTTKIDRFSLYTNFCSLSIAASCTHTAHSTMWFAFYALKVLSANEIY